MYETFTIDELLACRKTFINRVDYYNQTLDLLHGALTTWVASYNSSKDAAHTEFAYKKVLDIQSQIEFCKVNINSYIESCKEIERELERREPQWKTKILKIKKIKTTK